jgi:hypothetical protein
MSLPSTKNINPVGQTEVKRAVFFMPNLFIDGSVKPGIGVGVADVEGLARFGDVAGDAGADGKSELRIEILVKVVLDETFQDDG